MTAKEESTMIETITGAAQAGPLSQQYVVTVIATPHGVAAVISLSCLGMSIHGVVSPTTSRVLVGGGSRKADA